MGQENVNNQEFTTDLIAHCLKKGANSAEVIMMQGTDMSIEVRNNAIENSDFSDSKLLGIRVLIGQQSATVSGSDFSAKGIEEMIERAVANAKIMPQDPYAQIAPPEQLFSDHKPIDGICDPDTPELTDLKEKALETEAAALTVQGITNSEGAGCSFGRYHVALATSNGFSGSYSKTITGLSCSVLGGEGVDMQRDYDYATTCLYQDLKSARDVGLEAANRTIKKLNPQKMRSGNFPVILDKRVGRSFLGYFASAISADSISRGVSFLGNKVGESVFADGIHIIDNPHLKSGLASVPFDSEGVINHPLDIVQGGILQHLLVHGASSRKMDITNNGRAHRSAGGVPYPGATNMYMNAGGLTPETLYSDIDYGFYVTETIGHGLNDVTGDYSIGAAGFLIEKGVITSPVSEVTIAGNLKDVFKSMTPANDLTFESRKNVPTLRVECFTIAGA